MQMDMVDEFASMLQWLTDSFAIDPQDLSVLLLRQKQWHLQIRTSRSCTMGHRSSRLDGREPSHTSLLHSAVRAARSCNGCPMFPKSAMVLHTSRFSEIVEKWILHDFSGPVSCLVHVPPDTMSGILKNAVSLRCTCDIDWTTLDGCLGRPHEANNKCDAAPVCMSSWLNAFSDDDTQVYVDANLENTDEYGKKRSSPKKRMMWKTNGHRSENDPLDLRCHKHGKQNYDLGVAFLRLVCFHCPVFASNVGLAQKMLRCFVVYWSSLCALISFSPTDWFPTTACSNTSKRRSSDTSESTSCKTVADTVLRGFRRR